jgi:ankyrin repeat protein
MTLDTQTRGGETSLMLACKHGYTDIVSLLIAAGAALDLQTDGMYNRGYNLLEETALHIACRYGHIDIVHMLVDAGAALHVKATNGATALQSLFLTAGQSPSNTELMELAIFLAKKYESA